MILLRKAEAWLLNRSFQRCVIFIYDERSINEETRENWKTQEQVSGSVESWTRPVETSTFRHASCVQVVHRGLTKRYVSMLERLSHVGSMREAIPRQVRCLPLYPPSSSSPFSLFLSSFPPAVSKRTSEPRNEATSRASPLHITSIELLEIDFNVSILYVIYAACIRRWSILPIELHSLTTRARPWTQFRLAAQRLCEVPILSVSVV